MHIHSARRLYWIILKPHTIREILVVNFNQITPGGRIPLTVYLEFSFEISKYQGSPRQTIGELCDLT